MSNELLFISLILGVVAVGFIWKFGFDVRKWIDWARHEGIGPSVGIGIVVTLAIVLVLISGWAQADSEWKWNRGAYIRLGVDAPLRGKPSPQCPEKARGADDGASNLTAGWVIGGTDRVFVDVYANHQSCFFGDDRFTDDAAGIAVEYWFFRN